jgi:hypothetical protein
MGLNATHVSDYMSPVFNVSYGPMAAVEQISENVCF